MNRENKTWQTLKTAYIHQVEKALSSVNHPRTKEIITNVQAHLDQRFADLKGDEQTWENFQNIITDMGPAGDYAELLGGHETPAKQRISPTFLLLAVLIVVGLAAAMIILPRLIPPTRPSASLAERTFVNDPELIGTWQSVDFVSEIEDFSPAQRCWTGELFLKEMTFLPNGKTSGRYTWTKGSLYNGPTQAQYYIKQINGSAYLFMPWLSGDVAIRKMKPKYYVLKKTDGQLETTQPSAHTQAESEAVAAAMSWLKLIDDGDYSQSWDQAAAFFQNALPKDQWARALQGVRKPLGKAISRQVKSKRYTTSAPGAPDGQYVIIQFNTSFENKAHAVETVTPMLENDGSWRVSGYYIK